MRLSEYFQNKMYKLALCKNRIHDDIISAHWGRDKSAAISQTPFSNAFSWMKMYEFDWNLFLFDWNNVPINNIPAVVQIMAWRRSGDKPLSEPMMISLLTHICVTRPQWVNSMVTGKCDCNSLPGPIKVRIRVTIWRHQATMGLRGTLYVQERCE